MLGCVRLVAEGLAPFGDRESTRKELRLRWPHLLKHPHKHNCEHNSITVPKSTGPSPFEILYPLARDDFMSESPVSPEYVALISKALSEWRMQENIDIAFMAVYIHYVLTTVDEEVLVIAPHKRGSLTFGKVLFLLIRYMTLLWIPIHLAREYRTYLTISPISCKLMLVIWWAAYRLAVLASDVALGLCICALLGANCWLLILIMLISSGYSFAAFALYLVGNIQYPAEPVSSLDQELGYPCYIPSDEAFSWTVGGAGRGIRDYVSFGANAFLLILASITVFMRYRQHNGKLIQVLKRDGGLYYLAVTSTRFASAMFFTPAIIEIERIGSSPATIVFGGIHYTILPILAQRLLINMRMVDYMGSRPIASTILFAELEHSEYEATKEEERKSERAPLDIQEPRTAILPMEHAELRV